MVLEDPRGLPGSIALVAGVDVSGAVVGGGIVERLNRKKSNVDFGGMCVVCISYEMLLYMN